MRISEIFKINKSQFELDFVNIDNETDRLLFLDPYSFSSNEDVFSIRVSEIIRNFFQYFLYLVREDKKQEAKSLFYHLGEPNETCLGYSKDYPQGRGIGPEGAFNMYESLLTSKAVITGFVEDIEDSKIFIERIGPDKVSDMITNIIKGELIKYTQSQCHLWGIPLTKNIKSSYFWNPDGKKWINIHTDILVINNKKILLVPKGRVSFYGIYTARRYYGDFVLNYYRNKHLQMNDILVKKRKSGEKIVTKKDLEKQYPYSKDFLIEFTKRHPEIFEDFKSKTKKITKPLDNEFLETINLNMLIDKIIEKLEKLNTGDKDANDYHKLIFGILELMFYPDLINPEIEREINEDRKRIDITFMNGAKIGFFHNLHSITKTHCQYIFIECKNYSSDSISPKLDQLSGRFSPSKGMFGFIVCREIKNRVLFLKRCHDAYIGGKGLIIPLTDRDLKTILEGLKKKTYSRDYHFNKLQKIVVSG